MYTGIYIYIYIYALHMLNFIGRKTVSTGLCLQNSKVQRTFKIHRRTTAAACGAFAEIWVVGSGFLILGGGRQPPFLDIIIPRRALEH